MGNHCVECDECKKCYRCGSGHNPECLTGQKEKLESQISHYYSYRGIYNSKPDYVIEFEKKNLRVR